MEFLSWKNDDFLIFEGKVLRALNLNQWQRKKRFLIPTIADTEIDQRESREVRDIPQTNVLDVYYRSELQDEIANRLPKYFIRTLKQKLRKFFSKLATDEKIRVKSIPENFTSFFTAREIQKASEAFSIKFSEPNSLVSFEQREQKDRQKLNVLLKRIRKFDKKQFRSLSQLARLTRMNYDEIRSVLKRSCCNTSKAHKLIHLRQTGVEIRTAFDQFKERFSSFRQKRLSVKQIHWEMSKSNSYIKSISKTSFYNIFFKRLRLSYVFPKVLHGEFRIQKKQTCRRLTTYLIERIMSSGQTFLFFDETTMQMTQQANKYWYWPLEPREQHVRVTNLFLKLNLISTMEKIVSFTLTFDSAHSNVLANFVASTCHFVRQQLSKQDEIFVLMDYAPKNRSRLMYHYASKGLFRIVLTTPTTPQQNFVENLFFFIKKRLSKTMYNNKYGIS